MTSRPSQSAAQAVSDRSSLEDEYRAVLSSAIREFLGDVFSLTASVLPEPVSVAGFRSAWDRALARTRFAADSARRLGTVPDRIFAAFSLEGLQAVRPGSRRWESLASGYARTMATADFGAAQSEKIAAAGFPSKQWIAHHDRFTRASHREADGEVVRVMAHFTVGGSLLMYPGDPAAPPDDTYNCRCVMVGSARQPRLWRG